MIFISINNLHLQRNTSVYDCSTVYFCKYEGIDEYFLLYFHRRHRNSICIFESSHVFKFSDLVCVHRISFFLIFKPGSLLHGVSTLQSCSNSHGGNVGNFHSAIYLRTDTPYVIFLLKLSKLKSSTFS